MPMPPHAHTVEQFFAAPARIDARLSPDGTTVAYLAPWRDRLNVFIRDLDGEWPDTDDPDDPTARRLTSDDHRSIETFLWSAGSDHVLYLQDTDGDENHHLMRVGRASGSNGEPAVDLTPIPGARVLDVGVCADRPRSVFVTLNARRADLVDLVEVDLDTGRSVPVVENDGATLAWVRTPTGRVVGVAMDDDGTHRVSEWTGDERRSIAEFSGLDHPFGVQPCVPTPDGSGLWIGSHRGSDRLRLVRLDLDTGEETGVDSHPVFDLDALRPGADPRFPAPLIVHPATGALLGARYLGARQVIHALDPHFAEVLPRLAELSDGDLAHVSCDEDARRWVVDFTHDRDHRATWFYDHATGAARRLFRAHPHLDPARLAPVTPVTVRSRDGLDLPCHLTLPAGVGPRALPTVVLLHGGPWYRDSWTYDPEVQLLADRGYAVLQVNFRGSTGYGKAFTQAAIGEFAGRMHDDVIDALDWAIEQGYTDPDRVAIYGCSYGGYAALVGAAFTPDRFAAAISYTGMSDLTDLTRSVVPFARKAVINSYGRYIGDPDDPAQAGDMLTRSPISRVDDITAPVLLAHGANDVRVHPRNSERVVGALRARGAEVEYLRNEREGHWFINPDSNVELYRTFERFLARHLGGRSTTGVG